MSKFKVGDKVEYTIRGGRIKTTTVGEVKGADGDSILVDFEGVGVCHVSTRALKHSTPSPIRTVTRKEIVPGVYGKVCINEKGDGTGLHYINMLGTLDPTELREAAHILNQIAEALEHD